MSPMQLLANLSLNDAARIVRGSFIGALALLAYEYALSFADEVKYIWSLPRNSVLKWIFFFLRYVALACQICRRFQGLVDSRVFVTRDVCVAWYLLDVVTMEAMLIAVELVLMGRVYLLYSRDLKVGLILAGCLAAEIIAMVAIIAVTLPRVEFSAQCDVTVTWTTMAIFGTGVLIDHLLVLGVTLYKGFRFWRDTYRVTPLLPMVVRDGILTFIGLAGATAVNIIIFGAIDKSLSIIGSPWIISIMSMAGCKIIINIEAARDQRSAASGIELTTNAFGISFDTHYYGS